jgi:hypothetical protein
MQNNAGTSLSFERIEARAARPTNSGRADLIRAATHRWRMFRMMVLYRRFV